MPDDERPVRPDCSARVVILSHEIGLAQDFQAHLQSTIADIEGADLQALSWVAASQAQAAQDAAVCLLLAWDSANEQTLQLDDLLAHQHLRQSLQTLGLGFAVLRGTLPQQLKQALAALSRLQAALKPVGAQTLPSPGWLKACETCDEPECEHRLLTGLLKPGPDT